MESFIFDQRQNSKKENLIMNIDVLEEINKKGFAEEEIDPTLDLFA